MRHHAATHELHNAANSWVAVSSQVTPHLRLRVASRAAFEVLRALHRLVADVAELAVAFRACQQIVLAALLHNRLALGAKGAVLDVDVRVVVQSEVLLNQFVSYFRRQECAFFD